MKLRRALKIRLYPTLEPVIFLNKMLGCCRFLYNHMLAEWIQVYEALKEEKKEKSCERKRNRRGNLLEEKRKKSKLR
jgi:putative transposase